jgi:hypothetical protein
MGKDIHLKLIEILERTSMMSVEMAMTVCGKIISQQIVATDNKKCVTCQQCMKKITQYQ